MAETAAIARPRIYPRRRFWRARIALSLPAKALYASGVLSTKSLTLPDFLIIGAPKAGTTWLHENLDCHPDVFLARRPGVADPTEVRYFSQSFQLPLSYYEKHFVAGKGKIKGDKTPGYAAMPTYRIRFIRSIMPKVRLIFLMRNPIERAWSHAVMNLVKLDKLKIEDVPPSRFYKFFQKSREHGRYTQILDRWLGVFDREQFFTGFYDDIRTDPVSLMQRVCEHIGADTDVDWSRFPCHRVVNEGQRQPMPEEYRRHLEEMYREEIVQLDERLGGAASRWRSLVTAAHSLLVACFGLAITFADSFDDLADLLDMVF